MRLTHLCVLILLSCLTLQIHAQSTNIDELVNQMTLEQKVGQLFVFTYFGEPPNQFALDFIAEWQPGAVALLPSNLSNPEAITQTTNTLQQTSIEAGSLPLFIAIDQEGGTISRLTDGFTPFPVPMLLTATGNEELVYRVAQAMANEMRAVGINMNFAPIADLHTNPNNPIIGRRSFGSHPQMVAPILSAFVQGQQDNGILATAKHFPGHGDTDTDSHLTLPILEHDLDRLESVELVPFEATIATDVGAIMAAHISYPQLEQEENLPASLSQTIITDLLRENLEYGGLIMTDAMDMDAIDLRYSPAERAVMAVQAGHDLILIGAHVSPQNQAQAVQAVIDAVQSGEIAESRIDLSVKRILEAKSRFGVLDWQPLDEATASNRIDLGKHDELITELFDAGVTIVYNQHELPLEGRVAFLYPDTRFSLWRDCQFDSVELLPLSISQQPTTDQIARAQQVAALADVVVVFTSNADITEKQQALVNSLPLEKTFVVALWSPYDILAFPDVSGYMTTYSPFLNSNSAICSILFDGQPAQGQLPVDIGDLYQAIPN